MAVPTTVVTYKIPMVVKDKLHRLAQFEDRPDVRMLIQLVERAHERQFGQEPATVDAPVDSGGS